MNRHEQYIVNKYTTTTFEDFYNFLRRYKRDVIELSSFDMTLERYYVGGREFAVSFRQGDLLNIYLLDKA